MCKGAREEVGYGYDPPFQKVTHEYDGLAGGQLARLLQRDERMDDTLNRIICIMGVSK